MQGHVLTFMIILSAGALHWKVVSVYINRMGLVNADVLELYRTFFVVILDFLLSYHGVLAGLSENEEPACCRDNHQEEER